jgi:hypothetical protein
VGWYPDVEPPSFSQYGGEISSGNELTLNAPNGDIYYTLNGTDPRLPGGTINPDAILYDRIPILLVESARVSARCLKDGEWSALSEATFLIPAPLSECLRITELHYNPLPPSSDEMGAGFDDNDEFEFIEIKNISDTHRLCLSNLRFDTGVNFRFAQVNKIFLEPGEIALIVSNERAFGLRYGFTLPVIGQYVGHLDNGGEWVRLVDDEGNVILNICYDDVSPWPAEPDGNGYSLEMVSVEGDVNSARGWKASKQIGGNPGQYGTDDEMTHIECWGDY